MDLEKLFGGRGGGEGFVKTGAPSSITSAQKAALNRRGNVLFNEGDVEGARRIYEATGYSDGLSRVGDAYKREGRPLDAARMYWIAPDRTKLEPLLESMAEVLRGLLREEGAGADG
jgi:hypothetical protein